MGLMKDVKVVTIGDSGVGKSALLQRFIKSNFDEQSQATVGLDFHHTVYKLDDDTTVRLQFWDTAGQERYRHIMPSYIRDAAVVLLVFDLTKDVDQIARWALFVERERSKRTHVILVGTKSDKRTERKISSASITPLIRELNVPYFETSAKTGENVKELFDCIAHLPYPQHKKSVSEPIRLSECADEKKSCCSLLS